MSSIKEEDYFCRRTRRDLLRTKQKFRVKEKSIPFPKYFFIDFFSHVNTHSCMWGRQYFLIFVWNWYILIQEILPRYFWIFFLSYILLCDEIYMDGLIVNFIPFLNYFGKYWLSHVSGQILDYYFSCWGIFKEASLAHHLDWCKTHAI